MAGTNVPERCVPRPTSAEASILHQTADTTHNGCYQMDSNPVATIARVPSAHAFGSTIPKEEETERDGKEESKEVKNAA